MLPIVFNGEQGQISGNSVTLNISYRTSAFLPDSLVPDLVNRLQSVELWGDGQLREILSTLNSESTVICLWTILKWKRVPADVLYLL